MSPHLSWPNPTSRLHAVCQILPAWAWSGDFYTQQWGKKRRLVTEYVCCSPVSLDNSYAEQIPIYSLLLLHNLYFTLHFAWESESQRWHLPSIPKFLRKSYPIFRSTSRFPPWQTRQFSVLRWWFASVQRAGTRTKGPVKPLEGTWEGLELLEENAVGDKRWGFFPTSETWSWNPLSQVLLPEERN